MQLTLTDSSRINLLVRLEYAKPEAMSVVNDRGYRLCTVHFEDDRTGWEFSAPVADLSDEERQHFDRTKSGNVFFVTDGGLHDLLLPPVASIPNMSINPEQFDRMVDRGDSLIIRGKVVRFDFREGYLITVRASANMNEQYDLEDLRLFADLVVPKYHRDKHGFEYHHCGRPLADYKHPGFPQDFKPKGPDHVPPGFCSGLCGPMGPLPKLAKCETLEDIEDA